MKIIKQGDVKVKQHKTVCSACKSELLVDIDDGPRVYDQRDGDYIGVNCPVCKNLLTISVNLFT